MSVIDLKANVALKAARQEIADLNEKLASAKATISTALDMFNRVGPVLIECREYVQEHPGGAAGEDLIERLTAIIGDGE